jgi:4-hydroxybenzoate polyprenyltransferase
VNDVYDHDSDMQNPRKQKQNYWADGGILDPVDHNFVLDAARVLTGVFFILVLPASVQSLQILICTPFLLFLCWNYSSPPLRLKERPILDSLSNGVICWLLWACGYASGGNTLLGPEAGKAASNGYFVLFYASAMHSLAAVADAKPDTFAEHHTIATVLGERVAAAFSSLCL